MRFLILDSDYPAFLSWLYTQHPSLEKEPYAEQLQARMGSLFGTVDFYSSNLRRLGHEAWDIHANNEFAQKAWAIEHGVRTGESAPERQQWLKILRQARHLAAKTPLRYAASLLSPVMRLLDSRQSWFYNILAAQIMHYQPDVVLNHAMSGISTQFLSEMKSHIGLLVGQQAATQLSDSEDWSVYDLALSSFPPTVDWFRQKGIPAELFRLGFEPEILSRLEPEGKTYEVTFVGSLFGVHSSRLDFLEVLCNRFKQLRIWGPPIDHLPPTSPIRKCYVGQAWGREMYQVLRNSKITLNHHGDVAPYANNCRLYEATGIGTLLITDWKRNLHDLLEHGKEVIGYQSPEECIELIDYYLEHDGERETIAYDGQQRTLREHTYYQRMQEMTDIIGRYLYKTESGTQRVSPRTT